MDKLLNLNEFKKQLTEQISNLDLSDYELPAEFKYLFNGFGDYKIEEYYKHTIKVSSRKSICYIPNQWIFIAAICSQYCIELKKYKQKLKELGITDDDFEACHPSSSDKSVPEDHRTAEYLSNKAKVLLESYTGDDKEMLVSFLWDYDSWGGGKNIKRDNDFTVSPCLNVANSINASSSLIGDMSKAIGDNPSLYNAIMHSVEMETVLRSYSNKQVELLRESRAATFFKEMMKITLSKDDNLSELEKQNKYRTTDFSLFINDYLIGRDKNHLPSRSTDYLSEVAWSYGGKEYVLYVELTQEDLEQKFFPVYNDAYKGRLWIEKEETSGDYVLYEFNKTALKAALDYKVLTPVILYGPPGTGKTNKMQEEYINKIDEDSCFVTTFHQSFSYEEFVEGLKPVLIENDEEVGDVKYKVVDGIFKQACERAVNLAGYASLDDCIKDTFDNRKDKIEKAIEEHKYVLLCIDEINRGNVAAIFGDLISLIETSKRLGADHEMTAMLPYSKEAFGVPKNLLVVGTMNTADRSIQLLDSALRRRFKFEELGPDYSVFGNSEVQKVAKAILENMNAKIRCLLNKDNQIGHSYFMYAESYDDIYDALKDRIIPLLEEYFYNDVDKIRFVLSDSDKGDTFYVKDDEADEAYKAYAKDNFDDENKHYYILRENRPQNCEAFLKHMMPTKEKNNDVNE